MLAAALQLTAGADPAQNLRAAEAAVREAAGRGASLVVLPEKWLALGGAEVLGAVAEPLSGGLVDRLGALAQELSIDLVAGSISERPAPGAGAPPAALRIVGAEAREDEDDDDDVASVSWGPAALRRAVEARAAAGAAPAGGDDGDGRLFNTSVHFTPDGRVAATYRKVHLFDADVAGRRYRESDAERGGLEPVVTRLGSAAEVRLGLTICFDLRFPELFRTLATGGADVISVPAAFTERTTRDHWEVLLRARAIELGAFVVAANQVGEHPDGSRSGGQSMIIDPWGQVLARAGGEEPEIVTARLDLARVGDAREALPVGRLRRPDVYERPAGDGLRP